MNSTLIDLQDKLPKGLVDVYKQVQTAASSLQLEIVVVGAMARDLVLVHGFGARLERGTRDIDFAVQVRNWEAFEKLTDVLIANGFEKSKKIAHRLYLQNEESGRWEVDIVPCGQVADEASNIQWPPDGAIEMSTLGFDEAFENAFSVKMGSDLESFEIKVASPEVMCILKLISWLERDPIVRTKDALDLRYIMSSYCKIPVALDRMYDEGDMESQEWDESRASARILGRDAAKRLKKQTFEHLQSLLFTQPIKLNLLWAEMSPNFQEIDYENSELKVFIDALS